MEQHWLTILIAILIVGIIFDGVRRMRKAKRDSIKMALKPTKKKEDVPETEETSTGYGSEFPNGGARVSERKIDPNRINQARNKYNFGADMSAWKSKVAEKIAEHTGINKTAEEANDKKAPRIEPSFEHADPLLDNVRGGAKEVEQVDAIEGVERDSGLHTSGLHASDSRAPASDYAADYSHAEMIAEEDSDLLEDLRKEQLEQAQILEEAPIEEAISASVDSEKPNTETRSRSSSSRDEHKEPVQASLNLDDSVPMLMDSLNEGESDATAGLDKATEVPESIVTVGTHIEPVHEEEDRTLDARSANKPRYESKYADHSTPHSQAQEAQKQDSEKQVEAPQEVLVIHIRAAKNEYFYGGDLLELILDNGLRFGAMDIFHRHAGEDGEGPILFSMANMVKPGVFDLHTFEEFSTVGLSFFLGLPTETGSYMQAFDVMLSTAQDIAEKLQGELKDENRSVLTKQTIEHYRERIRDFSRRQQLEKNKP